MKTSRAAARRPLRVAAPRSEARAPPARPARVSGLTAVTGSECVVMRFRASLPTSPSRGAASRRIRYIGFHHGRPIGKAHLMTETQVPATPEPGHQAPDRNLALELVRVTEAAAMASARWVGRGDKNAADGAAVNAMRRLINTVSMDGVVVIGEGEKDAAPMLFNGEQVGDGSGARCDVAVDPIDGTRLTANGMPDAIAVIAVSARGSMYDPSAVFYMKKLVTGPEAAELVDIDASPAANIAAVARAKGCSPHDVTVIILDRPRHAELIGQVRQAGARIKLITDGDVAGAIMAARAGSG